MPSERRRARRLAKINSAVEKSDMIDFGQTKMDFAPEVKKEEPVVNEPKAITKVIDVRPEPKPEPAAKTPTPAPTAPTATTTAPKTEITPSQTPKSTSSSSFTYTREPVVNSTENDDAIEAVNETMTKDDSGNVVTYGTALAEQLKKEADTPDAVEQANAIGTALDNQIQVEQKTASTEPLPGSGQALNAVTSPTLGEPTPPSVMNNGIGDFGGLTPEEIAMYQSQNKTYRSPLAKTAMERLGVQEYFPNIDHKVAVGSYSRKTLGSGNIYTSGGLTIPMSVVDARARALEADIKVRQKIKDAIAINEETAPQYQAQFNDLALEGNNSYIIASGDNPERLTDMTDPLGREYAEYRRRVHSTAIKIKDIDDQVRLLSKAMSDPEKSKDAFYTKETESFVNEWLGAKRKYLEEYFSGKKDVSEFTEKLKQFQSIDAYTTKQAEIMRASTDEIPLNANYQGKGYEAAQGVSDVVRTQKGNGYDKVITSLKEYINPQRLIDAVEIAYNREDNSSLYKGETPEQLDKLKSDMLLSLTSKLGEKIKTDVKTVANDDMERARLAFDREKEMYDRNKTTYWENANTENVTVIATGLKAINQKYGGQRPSDPAKARQYDKEVVELYNKNNKVIVKNEFNQWVTPAPVQKNEKYKVSKNQVTIPIRYKDSKGKWVTGSRTPQQLASKPRAHWAKLGYGAEWDDAVRMVNSQSLQINVEGRQIASGSLYNDGTGQKLGYFQDHPNGQPVTWSQDKGKMYDISYDKTGKPVVKPYSSSRWIVNSNASDVNQRAVLDGTKTIESKQTNVYEDKTIQTSNY
jgi:hypothetical protein